MITLIHCAHPDITSSPPPGTLALAANLRKNGIDTKVIDIQLFPNIESVNPENLLDIIGQPTSYVGFSTMSNMLPFALKSAELLKNNFPQTTILFGGCGVQGAIKEILAKFNQVDFAFHGESDYTLPSFVIAYDRNKNWNKIPGLAFRSGSKLIVNPVPPRIVNLDNLPIPAYDLVDIDLYHAPINLVTTRGCPFHCSYCDGGPLRGKKPVNRSPESVINEIEYLSRKFSKSKYNFVDDTFTLPPERTVNFCKLYKKNGCSFSWAAMVRINTITPQLMEQMHDAGCKALYFGIESGSQKVLNYIHKNIQIKDVENTVIQAKYTFGKITTSFIWGFPFETLDDLEKTLILASYFQMTGVEKQLHLWSPMPKSSLFKQYYKQLVFDPEILSNVVRHKFDISNYIKIIKTDKKIFAPFYHVPHPDLKEKIKIVSAMGFEG